MSEIIAALLMILVTVSLSVVIFSFATSSMSSLETDFTGLLNGSADALAEQVVVEQVTFNVTGSSQGANLYIRNVGINTVQISAVYVTNETSGGFVGSFQYSAQINSGNFKMIGVSFVPTVGAAYGFTVATTRGNSIVAYAEA